MLHRQYRSNAVIYIDSIVGSLLKCHSQSRSLQLTCNATVGEALRLGRMQAWAITIGGASDLMAGDVAALSVFPRRFVAMSHLLLWRPTLALAHISGPTPGADGTNI